MKLSKQELYTIPNLLTILRIILVPIFIYCYMNMDSIYAAGIIFMSGVTDFLDGYIARKTKCVTELGKKLDPIADKLTQLAIVLCLSYRIPYMVWIFALFMIKEGAMLICYLYMRSKGGYMNGALWFGKISTAVFYMTMFTLLFQPMLNSSFCSCLMVITAVFLMLSFLLYMRTYFTMFKNLS